jgi:hypothetical protein
MVHPFGTDREDHYRFSGGDTALVLRLPDREVPLVRVWVDAVGDPAEEFLFQGEIFIDAIRHQIVRMRGQVLGRGGSTSLFSRMIRRAVGVVLYLQIENAEWDGAFWIPRRQRFEFDVTPAFSEDRALLRIVTAFDEIGLTPMEEADSTSEDFVTRRERLDVSPGESLRGFDGWRAELGAVSAGANLDDFDDVAPLSRRPTGSPSLRYGPGSFSEFLRYDRVEGLYTGFGATLNLRDRAPGASIGVRGGYAWAESTVRGRVDAFLRREGWSVGAGIERRLASTNDFPPAFGARPTILGVFGDDDFDYVDRYSADAHATAQATGGSTLAVEAGWVRDREPRQHVFRGSFRGLRPVREGDYARLRIQGTLGGRAGGELLLPGISATASWEVARGELDWHRVEGALRIRHTWRRWALSGEIHGGFLHSRDPPPQALFELGSLAGRLPGFEYKAFAGDRAGVTALQAMYVLPFLQGPIHLGPLFLPALSPSPALELSAGWRGEST